MSDPISRLDQFRADTPGAPMKSAAEVRHRGDQIRRRRRAVVTAGAVAAAAAVAGPIIFLSSGFGDRAIDPAPAPSETPSTTTPSPSGSASAGPSDLSRANLPVAEDLVAAEPDPPWAEKQTYDGEGKDAYNPCLTKSLGDSGADAAFRRDFEVDPTLNSEAETYGTLNAVVAEYASPEAAEGARQDIADAAASCTSVDAEPVGSLPARGGIISDGHIYVMTYLPDDPGLNARWEVATAVVTAENRVLVMTRQRGVQDYVSPTDLQTSAINAAHRMVGATIPAKPSTDPSAP
ncbi:MAG: hypothetical protein ACRDPS_21205, partial [Nocardioides sp.]|uniref:hypothetical protein n=1 Tax=Nocardioides sp. TaxID=35761 RepID=UPI003D6A20D4